MKVNHLKINYKKSHWVILSTLPDYYPWLKELNVGFYRIEPVLSVKYLGVIVDETISFSKYIQCISSKIAPNIGIRRKLKNFFPVNILRLIYFSSVNPYLIIVLMSLGVPLGHLL